MTDTQTRPYKIDVGMMVVSDEFEDGLVTVACERRSTVDSTSIPTEKLTPVLTHAGTRGLLLQQYRDASGYPSAVTTINSDGKWVIDNGGGYETPAADTEGKAILAALRDFHGKGRPQLNTFEAALRQHLLDLDALGRDVEDTRAKLETITRELDRLVKL